MISCAECGKTIRTSRDAYRRSWCRKSFAASRAVRWACPLCNEAAYRRSRINRQSKRFNLHF